MPTVWTQVELHVEKMIHFEGVPALRRLLDSGDRLSLHCANDDVFHSFGDRRRASHLSSQLLRSSAEGAQCGCQMLLTNVS